MSLDTFTSAYVECALWSSTGPDDEPLDATYDASDIAPETLASIQGDCRRFYEANREHFNVFSRRAGHDFWLTRNGHGAGFWDGDWPEPAATILDNASQAFREIELYVGDDGLIYA